MLLEMLKVPHLISGKTRSEVQAVNLDKIHGVCIRCSGSFAPKTPAPSLTKVPTETTATATTIQHQMADPHM